MSAVVSERESVHAGEFDAECGERELDGASAGEVVKSMKKDQAVFSAGEADEDVIALINHVPLREGSTYFAT